MSSADRLDPELLARLANLPLKARLIVEGALSGLHKARWRGSSVEFSEHKEYSPGDDLRHLDWKAYAKRDRYYVKQFEQESPLALYLVLDTSASMSFAGDGISKLEYAALSLAALAYLVSQQQDAVGLIACGNNAIDTVVPPRPGDAHLHELLRVLDQLITAGGTGDRSPADACRKIAEWSTRQRSMVVLASDLFDPDQKTVGAVSALRARRHDVVVLHVLDPHELDLPYDGLTEFHSLESTEKLLVNPAAIRREYVERMEAFRTSCRRAFADAGVDYYPVITNRSLERTLLDLLTARAALRSGGRLQVERRRSQPPSSNPLPGRRPEKIY